MMADTTASMAAPMYDWTSAICDSSLPPTVRHVALTFATHLNRRTQVAFPGPACLARETGLHVVTVKRSLRQLADEGWLSKVGQGGRGHGHKLANVWAPTIPTGSPVLPESCAPGVVDTPTGSRGLPEPGVVDYPNYLEPSTNYAGEAVETEPARSRADAAKMLRTLKGTLRNEQVLTTEPAQE
jgi:hypothetical protein